MNCFEIQVRGVTFTVWAPTLKEAVETFMIDMDFYEVPKELVTIGAPTGPVSAMFPPECGGF
jgi:hypothetical protein